MFPVTDDGHKNDETRDIASTVITAVNEVIAGGGMWWIYLALFISVAETGKHLKRHYSKISHSTSHYDQ